MSVAPPFLVRFAITFGEKNADNCVVCSCSVRTVWIEPISCATSCVNRKSPLSESLVTKSLPSRPPIPDTYKHQPTQDSAVIGEQNAQPSALLIVN